MENNVVYKTGSFTDYLNKEHKFVVCAVLVKHKDELVIGNKVLLPDECLKPEQKGKKVIAFIPVREFDGDGHLAASIFIGISVCSPRDKFDEELGKKIAYGKALSERSMQRWIASNLVGLLSSEALLQLIADNEVAYIQTNPGAVIKGYASAEQKYNLKNAAVSEYRKLTDEQKQVVNAAMNGEDIRGLAGLGYFMKDNNLDHALPADSDANYRDGEAIPMDDEQNGEQKGTVA